MKNRCGICRRERGEIYYEIREILAEHAWPTPEPLRQLAAITHFDLFISTTLDSLLEQASNQVRFAGKLRCRTFAHCKKEMVVDLPADFQPEASPTVHHFFGKLNPMNDFAVTDEDILQYAHRLQSRDFRPQNLFDQFRDKRLLTLGCSFPGWLTRFFLVAAKGDGLFSVGVPGVLADDLSFQDRELVGFRERKKTNVCTQGDAAKFVSELYFRWMAKFGQTAKEEDPTAADEVVGSFYPQAKDVKILRLVATQRGHRGWIRDVAVSPDRRFIATCGNDHSVLLWKLPPGGEIAVVGQPEFESWAADIHFSPATAGRPNRLLAFAGTSQGTVRGVDAFKERPLENWGPLAADVLRHTQEVRCISVSPDGTSLVTSSSDQTAIVWDAITGRPKFQISGHQGAGGGTVYHARYSADGKHIVTACNEGSARVWNAQTGASELMLVPDRQEIPPHGFKDFSALLALLQKPNEPVATFLLGHFTAEELAQLDNADNVDKTVTRVLNRIIRDGSLNDESAFREIVRRPMTVEWGKRKLGDTDRRILNRLILEDTFPAALSSKRVYDARFSRDGSKIVTADFGARTATIWDASDGRKLRVFPGSNDRAKEHSDDVLSAAFSPDGQQVVTASTDGYCRIWDAATGALLNAIPHDIALRSAEYNPQGDLLLTAAADGVARLWTLPGCQLRTELKGHTETLPDARFSRDGDYIITASRDGTARIYNTKPWWVFSLATQRVTRKLTAEERKQYGVERKLTPEEDAYYQKTESK